MRSVEVGGEHLTAYFANLLREKSVQKQITTPFRLKFDPKSYNFETKEKRFRPSDAVVSPSIAAYFEQLIARNAKEKALHWTPVSADSGLPAENTFELPDGEKIAFESNMSFDRHFFDKKEQDPQAVELQSLVSESLQDCDVDIRKNVVSGIVLAGGNSLIPKFKESFEEILGSFMVGSSKAKLVSGIKPSDRKLSSWVGSSILSSTGAFQNLWVSKGEYEETGTNILLRKCLN